MQRRGPNAVRRALSYPLSRVGTTGKSRSHAKRQEGEQGEGWSLTQRREDAKRTGIQGFVMRWDGGFLVGYLSADCFAS